ncbi:hypothetical protein B0J11DRAFT_445569 [Dendryphion nanum]|uniref:Pentatricopeptide repeat protein n=1 Tax=Dendryphion nanum TaxID=256645 RepID=A0A9P9IC30_9PLEO|nr:hypothetical protein B0J11DRAFT_445569 [Dendryphion nanum]
MQALWSRVARSPDTTCRCMSCLSNTTATSARSAIARRGGSVGIKGVWAFGTPTSTFVYTSIFAAGLTVDALAKRKRNEQWVSAFEHLREEMAMQATLKERENQIHVLVEEESITFNPDYLTLDEVFPDGVDWETLFRTTAMDLDETPSIELSEAKFSLKRVPKTLSRSLWDLLVFDSRFPGDPIMEWDVNTGAPLIRHNLPPQSMWSYDHVRTKALRMRHSRKKLAIQQISTVVMVRRLFSRAGTRAYYLMSKQEQASTDFLDRLSPILRDLLSMSSKDYHNTEKQLLSILAQLQQQSSEDHEARKLLLINCRKNHTAIPHYWQDEDGDFYAIGKQMNDSIKDIFRDSERPNGSKDLSFAIAKIGHNLLVSSVAPDVHTFNLLISGFKRWRLPDLVDEVLPALDACKIRPNEMTCAIVLDHFAQSNRPEQFSSFVARMQGVKNALSLARPDINVNEVGAGRLIRISEDKVYQKVYPTPLVFNSLMLGALRFAGFDRALDIYYEMKKDGWGLDVLGLTHFLVDCIERRDWQGGLHIWQEINNIKFQAKRSHVAKAYSNMLTLCSVTENKSAFNQLLSEIVRLSYNGKEIVDLARIFEEKIRGQQRFRTHGSLKFEVSDAISSYIADTKGPEKAVVLEDTAEPYAEPTAKPAKLDPEDAWAVWMLHELGEDINAKAEPQEASVKPEESPKVEQEPQSALEFMPNRIYMDPDEAWAIWMKHELGIDVREDANIENKK